MPIDDLLAVASEALSLVLYLSAPALLASLLVGAVASLVQAHFQLQDPTLTYLPRLAAVAVCLVVWGAWMGETLHEFTLRLWNLAG